MTASAADMARNVALYPWFRFLQNLLFWQATWFLYFQNELSAAEAILLYAVYDLSVTLLEVPSGYFSDRIGRRFTLIASSVAFVLSTALLAFGGNFIVFAAGQVLLGAGIAFNSGTDSALLYQSLAADDRAEEMEEKTLNAWRMSFAALALSAVVGGLMALWWTRLPYLATTIAMLAVLWITLRFREPPSSKDAPSERLRVRILLSNLRNPALLWLFALGVVMYSYSHIPFVFGQPFIAETLASTQYSAEAPLVSGAITTLMMGLSLIVSLFAPALRARLGLTLILLFSLAIQIGLAGALALTGSALAIGLLMLRMVPDSLSTPFIQAQLQHQLGDETRATFMSIKSLAGRIVFAASLWLAAVNTSDVAAMPLGDIQSTLGWYAIAGVGLLAMLAFAAVRLPIENGSEPEIRR